MAKREYRKTITDPNAPERLRGKVIVATIDSDVSRVEFAVDIPDDATPAEIGYLRWATAEVLAVLRDRLPPGVVGDNEYLIEPTRKEPTDDE